MLQLTVVFAVIGSALVVAGGYHFLIAAPALRRVRALVETHGDLLGGGASASTQLADLGARAARLEDAGAGVATRITALEHAVRATLPQVGFVRYNAFDDVGSDLSFALALVSQEGDGVVLSSIYSREETRTYGKAVEKFQTTQDASGEEKTAIQRARGR